MQKKTLLAFVLAVVALAVDSAHAQLLYNLTWLKKQGYSNNNYAINDFGQVVGQSQAKAFLWDRGVTVNLATLPQGTGSLAMSINNSKQIAGWSYFDGTKGLHAVLWENGAIHDLGGDSAPGINNRGQVIVERYKGSEFIWENGQITDLGDIGRATGINDQGQVIAFSTHGILLDVDTGIQTNLGELPSGTCIPLAINNLGQVIGQAGSRAFIWDKVNGAIDLGSLGGGRSAAYAINDLGQVVGYSNIMAFIWENGVMRDLNALIPPDRDILLSRATGINNNGQIVGFGWTNLTGEGGASPHPFVLTPIPEPATLLLLALGSVAILRKRRTAPHLPTRHRDRQNNCAESTIQV